MFKTELSKLIALHQKDVRLLFSRYGYSVKTPNAQNVIDACIVLKDDFKNDLGEILENSNSFNGGKFLDWINNGLAELTGKKTPEKNTQPQPTEPTEQPRILGINKTLFIIICIVLFVLLVMVLKKIMK